MCYMTLSWQRIWFADGDRRFPQRGRPQVLGTDVILIAGSQDPYIHLLPVLDRRQLRWYWYPRADELLDALENESVDPAMVLIEAQGESVRNMELCQQLLACRPGARVVVIAVPRLHALAEATGDGPRRYSRRSTGSPGVWRQSE